jgi:hypothetical protein
MMRVGQARRAFLLSLILAAVALFAAVSVNLPLVVSQSQGPRQVPVSVSPTGTAARDLDRPPVQLLPTTILGYETIARQPVPGRTADAAEAVYVTLSMSVEAQVPIAIYARVEGFSSADDAEARVAKLMISFPRRGGTRALGGGTIARTGYASDDGALLVAWSRGGYMTYVKTSFKDKVPATPGRFLASVGDPVVKGVDIFQRTGLEGANIQPGDSR